MDVLNDVLLWLHLLGLVMGGGALLGGAIVSRLLPAATAEQRAGYLQFGGMLSGIGRAGLGMLIVTGLLMLWLKWGGSVPNGTWFMVKMVLVLVVIVGVVLNGLALKRLRSGDGGAVASATQWRLVTSAALVLVVLAAVFAFN